MCRPLPKRAATDRAKELELLHLAGYDAEKDARSSIRERVSVAVLSPPMHTIGELLSKERAGDEMLIMILQILLDKRRRCSRSDT